MDNGLNETVKSKKTNVRHPDRVTLTPNLLTKMDGWIKQVTDLHRGVRLTRNNLVDWLIDSYPVELPTADVKAIAERYYDEERFLKDAMRELRARKARGESVNLDELLTQVGIGKAKSVRKPRKPRADKSAVATNASNNIS